MFKVLEAAGMTPANVARLLNASRVTVSLWVNGHSKPHHLIERRVHRLLSAVESAVNAGDLPISGDVPRKNRHAEIAKVVHRHLNKMNLGAIDE